MQQNKTNVKSEIHAFIQFRGRCTYTGKVILENQKLNIIKTQTFFKHLSIFSNKNSTMRINKSSVA